MNPVLAGVLLALLSLIGGPLLLWLVWIASRALLWALARRREIRIQIVGDLRYPAASRPSGVLEVDEPLTQGEWRGRAIDGDSAGDGL